MKKCPIYLHFPWRKGIIEIVAKQISQTVLRWDFLANLEVAFHSKPMLTSIHKYVLLLIIMDLLFTFLGLVATWVWFLLFSGINKTLFRLFNAKSFLLEEQ